MREIGLQRGHQQFETRSHQFGEGK